METNKILYVYIDHYKGVNDLEVCLDDRYEIHFDKVSNKLSIKESGNHIDGFWGKKIYSLAAIVGENGSGKTTTIRYILEAVVSGYQKEVDDNIVVMKKGNGIIVYTRREIMCDCRDVKIEWREYSSLPSFYYSAHFGLPLDGGDILYSQFGKEYYNASDGFRLVRDFRDYSNVDTLDYGQSLYNHLLGYYVQNEIRICTLLGDHYDEMKKFGLRPPRYLQVVPDTSGKSFLQNYKHLPEDSVPEFPSLEWPSKKCKTIAWFAYNILINIAATPLRFGNPDSNNIETNGFEKHIKKIVGDWVDNLRPITLTEDSLIRDFNEHIDSINSPFISPHTDMKRVLSRINEYCLYWENIINSVFYFDMEEGRTNFLKFLEDERNQRHFPEPRHYYLEYFHGFDGNTVLSSGEQAMLDLYSRLYATLINNQNSPSNTAGPQLIVLDEAEIGYHPEWQRRFVKNVTQFLNSLNVPDEFFQIVLTSHSPLILSDIPLACTSYLTREDKDRPKQETFGANIFDLYHNSFFLEEGMIGEFAMEKIEKVVHLIDVWKKQGGNVASDEMKKARQVINLIANERLKDYLMDELSAIDKEGAIEYYQQKIDNLKQGKHEQN